MIVYKVSPEEWGRISEKAHIACFNEKRPPEMDRYHFALVVCDESEIYAYSTIIEVDSKSCYMQHGGSLPNVRGTTTSYKAYRMMVQWLKANYSRISTRIQNNNRAMIKMALSEDLTIDGVNAYGSNVFLSLGWGFRDA